MKLINFSNEVPRMTIVCNFDLKKIFITFILTPADKTC